tara:strand:- start:393 stop:701 length:309 start_codon:yes stop_codon:yes gene_type:complete
MMQFMLFKNQYKTNEEGDRQPSYKTGSIYYKKDKTTGVVIKTFEEDVTFKKGEMYSAALFKNSDGSLGVKIELNTYDKSKEKNSQSVGQVNSQVEGGDDIPF